MSTSMHMFMDLPSSSHVSTSTGTYMCSNLEEHMPFVPRPTEAHMCSDLNTYVHKAPEQLLGPIGAHTCTHMQSHRGTHMYSVTVLHMCA